MLTAALGGPAKAKVLVVSHTFGHPFGGPVIRTIVFWVEYPKP